MLSPIAIKHKPGGRRDPETPAKASAWSHYPALTARPRLPCGPRRQAEPAYRWAQDSGIGAGLYDRLIGEAAIVHDIPIIITRNIKPMRGLFPSLTVATPNEFGDSLRTGKKQTD